MNAKNKTLSSRLRIAGFRLARHHLAGKARAAPSAICRDVCGIQAQVMSAAALALWARNHQLARAEIQSALWESRTLVKTGLMRGTLHLVAAEDFPVYIAALRSSRVRQTLQIMARYGVSEKEARAAGDAVIEMLRAGPLTKQELTERVLALGIASKKARRWFELSSWGVGRMPIVEGRVCYGPARGQDVTLIRTDRWLPEHKPVSEQEGQRIFLRRYLGAYGPADARDFSKWSGLSASEVRSLWLSLESELVAVNADGRQGFMLREDADALGDSDFCGGVLRLLPNFDAYLLGHLNKDHLLDARHYKRVYRNQGWISPTILLDGKIIGTWSYAPRAKTTIFTIQPFEALSKAVHTKIEEETRSLANFLQTPLKIAWKP
ncbi:MAG: hypothetical protein DMG21_21155 [Acidobacteria bacterium]|nr:MAG: hypothetical protein DMG21_21155 [Acidobacteriota bacterium]